MSQATSSSAGGGANIELGATLLLTTTNNSRNSSSKSSVAIDLEEEEEEEEEKEERIRRDIARIVKEKDLKSLDDLGGVDSVSAVLCRQHQHSKKGTIDDDNTTIPLPAIETNLSKFLFNSCKFYRCTILVLLISAGLSFAIEFKQEEPKHGDEVPADGLLASDGILVLAEPEATKIKHDRKGNPFLISGSKVIGGQGRMLATSVGTNTNLAERSDGNNSALPEMKGKVSIGLLMKALERAFLRPQGTVSILTRLVTVAILCVQHGMPLVVTVSLKYQTDKVVPNQDAVLNDLSACTTMGLVTVICIDVSDELISKPMEVSRVWMREKDISMVEGSKIDKTALDMLKQGIGLSVLAPEISLSSLSVSLVSWAETTWAVNMRSFTEEKFDILKHSNLNSGKKKEGEFW
ncbi:hypothetical protein JHK86_005858 [Glycine max]|nr:hypothetical protein JHK86_005858 [Glycine max]